MLRAKLIAPVLMTALVLRMTADARGAPGDPPPPGLLFAGDFDSCDLSQWPHRQDGGRDDIAAVPSPLVRPGSACSGFFSTGRGDGIGETSPRNELYRARDAVCCNEGDERWLAWDVRLRGDWPYAPARFFSTILQLKSADASSGQLSFIVSGERVTLQRDGERWGVRITRGRWHHFLMRVRFSRRSDRGSVRLFYDRRRQAVNGGRRFATLANRNGAYLKIGLYRSAGLPRATLHHDGLRLGLTRRSVEVAG